MNLLQGLIRREGKAGIAYFSQDGLYRYALERRWADGLRTLLWIMLNPSVADHERNDLTITKCVGFSKALEASALRVVNLFAFISTDPKELLRIGEPEAEGSLNIPVLREAGRDCDRVICAWGGLAQELRMRSWATRREIKDLYGDKLRCLGRTSDNSPRHPSRLAYATALENWS